MMKSLPQLLLRWATMALGVVLATKLVRGIHCEDGATLLAVVLLLSFLNAILKPVLLLFTLPFILLTMGLGVIVINALLFLFVGHLVDGFWSAFWGAVIVSVTNMVISGFARKSVPRPAPPVTPRAKKGDEDVIDI